MKIVFAGTSDFAVSSLQALLNSPHTVTAVFTQPDRPAGRGRRLQASPVKTLALSADIPVFQPARLTDAAHDAAFLKPIMQADIMVVVAYGLLLPRFVLSAPPHGCINVHGSLLPRWRGAAPIQQAILAGDTETGVTIMQMVLAMDAGPVLKQARCPIAIDDTAQLLHDKLAALGAHCLLESLDALEAGHLVPLVQDDSRVTYAHKIKKTDGLIDWTKPADYLARHVRAFNAWPVAYGTVEGLSTESIRIWRAEAITEDPENTAGLSAGSLLRATDAGIDVVTGQGVLRLLEVQRAGGRRLSAADFVHGLEL